MKKSSLTTVYIVRHGKSEANVNKVVAGTYNSPLSLEGEQQSKKLARKLKNVHFDAIFSSDLIRAKRTAEIIAVEKKLAVQTSRLLRERYFGNLEGQKESRRVLKLFEEYEKLSFKQWLKHRFVEGAENSEEIIFRFITFLREIAIAYKGKTILIVSHGSIIRSFLIHIGLAPHTKLIHGTISNNAHVKVETDGIDFFVKETSWKLT